MNDSNIKTLKRIKEWVIEWWGPILILAILAIALAAMQHDANTNPCFRANSFTCANHKMNQCLASELYTKAECLELVGSK